MTVVLTFDTTHHALWAEEIAREHALGVQVINAPAVAKAKCGLALEALEEDLAALQSALDSAGVAYRIFTAT